MKNNVKLKEMKFTKEQRHEIYKELLEKVDEPVWDSEDDHFICWKLWVKLNKTRAQWDSICCAARQGEAWKNYEIIKKEFPEFSKVLPEPNTDCLKRADRIKILNQSIELSKPN
jgi:hypothetical protein